MRGPLNAKYKLTSVAKRRCKTCNREKELHLFYSTPKWTCKSCFRKTDAYQNQRDRYLQDKYGITVEEYNVLLEAGKGSCWICGGKSGGKNLAVDHNHRNGRVRGLLCKRCNSVLARMMDDGELLWKAYDYLGFDGGRVQLILGRETTVPDDN